jgi:PAS domain S-box-containing protein
MKLSRKIMLVTIGVLFVSLLISSVVNILGFRKNYTEALVAGSYGIGQDLNSVVGEMLGLGLPLESMTGMDKKLRQLVQNNPHIAYAGISDANGTILYHSDAALVGKVFADDAMKKPIDAADPLTQTARRVDGQEYFDLALPILDSGKARVGITRLGFRTEVVSAKVRDAIVQVAVNFTITFLIIALAINALLSQLVSKPVIALSDHARRIADGQFDVVIPVDREDEIGILSGSLNAMAATIKAQLQDLQRSHDNLEQQVVARTSEVSATLERVKHQETALRESETHLRTIIENEPECIKIVDAQGYLVQMNPAGLVMIEADSLEQVAGQSVFNLIVPESREAFAEMHKRVLAGEATQMEFEVIGLKGGRRWLETHAVPMLENGRMVHLAVTRDISARKIAEAELLRSNVELEQFSFSISHDMRQPLRMISSYLQLIEKKLDGTLDQELRGYFNFAIDGAKRMETMMVGLLEYSRIGRKGEPMAWIESRAMLEEALLFLRSAVAEAQARISIEGSWPCILVSRNEMLRLMQNLVGNAIKFRSAGRAPEITITGALVGNAWRLCVADNGIGIIPDQIDRLFQMFQRLQSRAAFDGTGIGLALCRKIAEHHHGRIWAESKGEGLGSRFCVELPVEQTA